MLPKITISVPTYNAAADLPDCLTSIRKQNYPQDKIEIIVADGGSEDNTVEIAKRFGVKVFHNEKKLADYGAKIIVKNATGDLLVVFAADNELGSEDWALKTAEIFERHPDVSAVWGRIISGKNDPPINKYYELIQNDPFTFFMNKNLSDYLKEAEVDNISEGKCYIFDVDAEKPLIWGANGLVFKMNLVKDIILREGFVADNDVFQIMIENGHSKVAYMPTLETVHHHVSSLWKWTAKWQRNFIKHLLNEKETRNLNWVFTAGFRKRVVGWMIYSLIPVFPLGDSIYKSITDKNIYWLYHPLTCFVQTLVYSYIVVSTKSGRKMVFGLLKEGKTVRKVISP